MSSIMGPIRPERLVLFALESEKLLYLTLFYTLESTNINQSAPNLVKMYMTIRSLMSLISGLIGPNHLVYFTLFTL